jgi:LysM repeat protein
MFGFIPRWGRCSALGLLLAGAAPPPPANAFMLAQEAPAQEPPEEPPPTKAPAHADCDHRMPLFEHVVEAGEHLGAIAGRYGVRRRDLMALNADLLNPDLIRPGQKIRVCPEIYPRTRKEVVLEVRRGDTLSEIAHAHGLSVQEIIDAQEGRLRDANHLRVGQTLRFQVDGGLVEDFQPPPKTAKRSTVGTSAKRPVTRVDTRLEATRDLHIKRPHLAFGTAKTIGLIEKAVAQYKRKVRGGPKVLMGDISKRGGGTLNPHASHRTGRDVDVGYVLTGEHGNRTRFSGVNRENLDLARTWALVKAFLDTHEVLYIFMDYGHQKLLYDHARSQGVSARELDELFQYPRGRGRSHGIVRHWPSHKHHFHVRFRP